jgi:hypothetical protein
VPAVQQYDLISYASVLESPFAVVGLAGVNLDMDSSGFPPIHAAGILEALSDRTVEGIIGLTNFLIGFLRNSASSRTFARWFVRVLGRSSEWPRRISPSFVDAGILTLISPPLNVDLVNLLSAILSGFKRANDRIHAAIPPLIPSVVRMARDSPEALEAVLLFGKRISNISANLGLLLLDVDITNLIEKGLSSPSDNLRAIAASLAGSLCKYTAFPLEHAELFIRIMLKDLATTNVELKRSVVFGVTNMLFQSPQVVRLVVKSVPHFLSAMDRDEPIIASAAATVLGNIVRSDAGYIPKLMEMNAISRLLETVDRGGSVGEKAVLSLKVFLIDTRAKQTLRECRAVERVKGYLTSNIENVRVAATKITTSLG